MKKRSLFSIALMTGVVVWMGSLLIHVGAFKGIEPHFNGSCQVVGGIIGAEDMTFIPNQNVALISAYDRRATKEVDKKAGIFSYDLKSRNIEKISPPLDDFSPHGMSLYNMPGGGMRLFVINHASEQHQINVFDFIDGSLKLKNTIRSKDLISPNDLVAVGPNQFYVTNDHRYAKGTLRTLEDYLRWSDANVVFYDGNEFKEVIGGVGYPNGINVSRDGELLYLNSITSLSTLIYKRNKLDNELTLLSDIYIGSGVDNIEIDAKGDLWMGAHPKLLAFSQHAKYGKALSPSQVIKLSKKETGYQVEEVYLDSGAQISGASVAATKNERMLIGAVFAPYILDCTLTGQ